MSAFLAPIHTTMYNRILMQDAMTEELLQASEQSGWSDDLRSKADAKAPAARCCSVEEVIDLDNIHGWLSQSVSLCENRFSFVVKSILENHPERLSKLQDILFSLGSKYTLVNSENAEDIYADLTELLLDGMPCDRPFAVISSNPEEVVWKVENCPHISYWQQNPFDVNLYYTLRKSFIDGLLQNSGFHFQTPANDGIFTLRKEKAHGVH